ncbi:hypothetical protein SSABA_v1c08810 [Spiroplasma sabaudiense Ar-1343]|uniref:Probable membrane transporter protein n=1 Tax=Spiroplasma sabaudiense Ar-1343 TaxID=1276257 RepID=W6ABS0_9MOLU|nr:sulfite exporter TauE/SafE family protein [Spiroplasma sabaudiense]AHI54280.1 hypothetical protein SSABA_v1c08810 [Spiroplasma sabaudiense Ar-1343]
MSLFILIPILFVIALLVSGLGSVSGVGGGVLFVPLLLILLPSKNIEEIKFISTLLVFVSATINVIWNLIKKNINYLVILIGIVASVPAVFLGRYIAGLFSLDVLKIIIGAILIFVSILLILVEYVFKNKEKKNNSEIKSKFNIKINEQSSINIFKLIFISIAGGLITSLTGMGGGPILMPILLIWCGLTMGQASPISHSLIAGASLISLLLNYHLFGDFEIMVKTGLPMLIGVIIGTIVAIAVKKYITKEIYIKWILIVLIWISAIKLILDVLL